MIPLLTPFNYLVRNVINLFKGNKIATGAIAVVLVLSLVQCRQCNNTQVLKKKLAVAEHNLNAANDTIRYVKDREGKAEYDKLAFLTNKVGNLEKLNSDLAAEVKKINGKVSSIIKADVQIKEVEKQVPFAVTTQLTDSLVTANFHLDTIYSPGNFRKLSGFTQYNLRNSQSTGALTQFELSMRFNTGIKNLDKGKPEIFLKSDYPGFTVTALDGAILDPSLFSKKPKAKLITTGINIGWTPFSYDVGTKKVDINFRRFGATAGININILKLLKP